MAVRGALVLVLVLVSGVFLRRAACVAPELAPAGSVGS